MVDQGHRTPTHRLRQLQRSIYRSLEAKANSLLGKTPKAIAQYEKEFLKDFRQLKLSPSRFVQKHQLITEIRESAITLVGDFHTFYQAQRTALRFIREVIKPGENWMIGIEFLPSSSQHDLDAFQEGKIDLPEFHARVRYAEDWGFPWANYEPIFDWARAKGVRLLALNRPKELAQGDTRARENSQLILNRVQTTTDLFERDRWAAGILLDQFENASPRILVLFGELHLSRSHLPHQIEQIAQESLGIKIKCLSIHQTVDTLYWNLPASLPSRQTPILKISASQYCVFSSTPWAKLQSLVSWIEGENLKALKEVSPSHSQSSKDEEDDDDESETDYLNAVQTFGETISQFLDLPKLNYENLTLLTADQADLATQLEKEDIFTPEELKALHFHIRHNLRLFIPRINVGYFGIPSQNGAAEIAAVHLLRSRTLAAGILPHTPEEWFRSIIESTFGFYGSLLLNPRRKCYLIDDHRKRVKQIKKNSPVFFPQELESRELTLKFLTRKQLWIPPLNTQKSRLIALLATRHLGQVLGTQLHFALLQGLLTPERLRYLCLARMDGSGRPYRERIEELLGCIQQAELPESKEDWI